MTVNIVSWEGKTISVDLPNQVDLEVAETDPGVKGNTQGGKRLPLFVATPMLVVRHIFCYSHSCLYPLLLAALERVM